MYVQPSVHPSFLLSICPKESKSQEEGHNGLLEGSEGMPDRSEGLPEGSESLQVGSKGFLEGPARRVSRPIRGPAWGDRQMHTCTDPPSFTAANGVTRSAWALTHFAKVQIVNLNLL